MNIKSLPIDILKLDQTFARGLSRLALAGQRFVRLASCFVAGLCRKTAGHFSETCLGDRRKDLHCVLSRLSLARGLDERLVIEGVETAEILDALMILGVAFVQGCAIARPMPVDRSADWIGTYGTDLPLWERGAEGFEAALTLAMRAAAPLARPRATG